MVIKKSVKLGFSLMEAMVVLLLLSVFFAATAKVFTSKHATEISNYEHGEYACWNDGSLYEHYKLEGTNSAPQVVQSCTFRPRLNASIYHIYIFTNGHYKLKTISNINQNLTIEISSNSCSINGEEFSAGTLNDKMDNDRAAMFKLMYPGIGVANGIDFFGSVVAKNGILISW